MAGKIYIIDNLDCANCAAKIEKKFNDHPQVESATITFATKQLRVTAENPDGLIGKLTEIARTVESGATIMPRDGHRHAPSHEHHHGCGHHHDHDHEHAGEHGHFDPHYWMDPLRAQTMVDNLHAGLLTALPEHADRLRTNAELARVQLQVPYEMGRDCLHLLEENNISKGV